MMLGVLARIETARGIGIQTRSFIEHMPVNKILKILTHPIHGPVEDSWPDSQSHGFDGKQLDEGVMRNFLSGLDVLFAVETLYDWRVAEWAREMGVVTVVQGNPEFYRHGTDRGPTQAQQPTEWWWPTTWRMGHLPSGPVMMCPQPDRAFEPTRHDGPLRVLHTVGKHAHGDRNGTEVFVQAMRYTKEPMHVTVTGIDGEVRVDTSWPQKNLTWDLRPDPVPNRWMVYRDQDILVLPRRYGGNCLPALEAAACGLAVAMPNISPNDELAGIVTYIHGTRPERLPCGVVQVADPNPIDIAEQLDVLARNRGVLAHIQATQYERAQRWSAWAPRYMTRLEHLVASPTR